MFWIFIAASFASGLVRRPWWTVVVLPVLVLALAVLLAFTEPETEGEMTNAILYVIGAVLAVLGLAAALAGRVLAMLVRYVRRRARER